MITNNLTNSLENNINQLIKIVGQNDTILHKYIFNDTSKLKGKIVFIDGMVDNNLINDFIISPFTSYKPISDVLKDESKIESIAYKVFNINEVKISTDLNEAIDLLFTGYTLLFIDGFSKIFLFNTKGFPIRSITEPLSETVVRGPREGFVENIIINLTLLRKKIPNKELKTKFKTIGDITKTKVSICYIDGICQNKIVREVERRLDNIKIDGILDINYIEEMIQDSPLSIFRTLTTTERPDIVAGKLLEGRVAIFCDGCPGVITAPFIFIEYFQFNEDYYVNFYGATLNRIIRYISFFLTTSIPALYLALTIYHKELLPTQLALSIFSARQGVPFPTIIELVVMLFIFEVLRDAGTRLPKHIGQAVSIVGALVLGQSAVEANFVSPAIIIIAATTGITSFMFNDMFGTIIIIRIYFLAFSTLFGLYGYIMSLIGVSIYLMSLRSFGVSYMLYTKNISIKDIKDVFIRVPWWYMSLRPKIISVKRKRNKIRYK